MRRVHCYVDSDDKAHTTLEQCQVAELRILFGGKDSPMAIHCPNIFELIVEKAALVVNILNVTEKSRLGARKLNGAKRKSRIKPEQASLPIEKPY